jgi:hypothetical protein
MTAELLCNEIEQVHAFIAAWFRGDMEQDDAAFEARLANRFDHQMINIQPSGQLLTRSDLLGGLRSGYGANPNFQIEILNCELRFQAGGQALVTYVEQQRGAKNTVPADNRRVSSVLFDISGAEPRWLHIHETAVP